MDELIRMITTDGYVKAMAVSGREMVERARQIHKTWPVATAALGRTLMGASMMGSDLKGEGSSLTLRIRGGGPLGTITAVSDSEGNVRGYVQNGAVDLPRKAPGKLDVGSAVGQDGEITVIKDLGLKEPYVGSIQLVGGEIAEDIAAYFVESEQIPTACALGVLVAPDGGVTAAGGFLVQLLPGAPEETITLLEKNIAALGPVSQVMDRGVSAEEMLRQVLEGFESEVLERAGVEYRCYCSRERVSRALISLGAKELREMIDQQGSAQLTCQFCDAVYDFTAQELEELLRSATS